MNCTYYQTDTLHTLSEPEIKMHIESCPLCAERIAFEEKIIKEASSLNKYYPSEELWSKIENTIDKGLSVKPRKISNGSRRFLSIAAILFIIATSSVFYVLTSSGGKNILTYAALLKVEYTESNYIEAIEDLEQKATPVLSSMDVDLMLLYRDKLETIQNQINKCSEAVTKNPGNAHIRRYMLAALRDKKETLNEILTYSEN